MIQLYSLPTANGQKAQIALEEAGLPYKLVTVDLTAGDHRREAFLAINPFGKAPALHDPDGVDGQPISLGESLAIACYAAEKAGGAMMGQGAAERAQVMMWAAAVSSSVATPFAMQFLATRLAPEPMPWLEETMVGGCEAALALFDRRLSDGRAFVMGERFTIVDCLFFPVAVTSSQRLAGGIADHQHLLAYVERVGARPAVRRAMAAGLEDARGVAA